MSASIACTSWKLAIGRPNCCALLGVLDRRLHAALADADAAGGHAVAPGVQRGHGDLEAVADLAEHRVLADLAVAQRDRRGVGAAQAHLVVDLLGLEAVVALGLDQEAGQPAVTLLGVGLGEDHRHLGVVAERDPHLGAVDDPARVGPLGPGALVGGVRTGVGLGQAEAPQPLARAQLGQVALLLLLGAPAQDRRADQRGLDRDHGAHRGVAAADLLHDQPVGQVVEPRAAVLAGDDRAEVALVGDLAAPARGRSARCDRSLGARATISLSVKARAVSRIRRCSSVSSKSMAWNATRARLCLWPGASSDDAGAAGPRRRPGDGGRAAIGRCRPLPGTKPAPGCSVSARLSCGERRQRRLGRRRRHRRGGAADVGRAAGDPGPELLGARGAECPAERERRVAAARRRP